MKAQVSVIVPFHNPGRMLVKAVTSALAQSYPVTQVICVDDGSTDGSAQLLADISDDRLQVIRVARNCGKGQAMNAALQAAEGDFLLELDADDWLPSEAARLLVYRMSKARSGVVGCYGDRRLWRRGRRHFQRSGWWRGSVFTNRYAFILDTLDCPPGPRFVSREAILETGGWPVDDPSHGRLYEDYRLWLKLLGIGELTYCPHPVYDVWRRQGSSTNINLPLWRLLRNIAISQALQAWQAPVRPVFGRRGTVRLEAKDCVLPRQRVHVQITRPSTSNVVGTDQTMRTLAAQTHHPVDISSMEVEVAETFSSPLGGLSRDLFGSLSSDDYVLRIEAGTWLAPDALVEMVNQARASGGAVSAGLVRLAPTPDYPLALSGRVQLTNPCVLSRNGRYDTLPVCHGPILGGITYN